MTLRETYEILQAPPDATLDQIKSNYRRLAFKLHPDLNPDDKHASKRFQRLNEAYVILRKHIESGAEPPPRPTGTGKTAGPKARQYGRKTAPGPSAKPGPKARKSAERERSTFHYKQEDVLHDILKDPFARKVFEDIYAQVKRDGGAAAPKKFRRRKLELDWGEKRISLDLSRGLFGGMKNWLRGQLDDEHVARLPASSLLPGRTVRISLTHGFKGKKKNIEVRLPKDFVPGRPVRLKGLGRRLGPFKGDLYLRFYAK